MLTLPHRCKEAIRAMAVRPQPQPRAFDEFVRTLDARVGEGLPRRQHDEIAMGLTKGVGNTLVFNLEQAACRVDETAAGLHERRGARKDRFLLRPQFGHGLDRKSVV